MSDLDAGALFTRDEGERLVLRGLRAAAVLVLAWALGAVLAGSSLRLELSGIPQDSIEGLVEWAEAIPGPLEVVLLGPPGHRDLRAAHALLARLAAARGATRVRVLDPDTLGVDAGLGRKPRAGEVLIQGAGRQALATDASPRSLGAALRGLADPRPREVRFLVRVAEGPARLGAPRRFARAGAIAAAELGVQVSTGPPDPGARTWVVDVSTSDPGWPADLQAHLEAGGAAVVLIDDAPPPAWARWLEAQGLRVAPGWLVDREEGPNRTVAALRVRPAPAGPLAGRGPAPVGLLSGVRPLEGGPGWTPLYLALDARHASSEAPVLTGAVDPGGRVPALARALGGGWLAVVGDRDGFSHDAVKHAGTRELWVRTLAYGLDRRLGLPASSRAPFAGVDPDLDPAAYRRVAVLLLVVLPGVPLLVAIWLGARRREGRAT